MLTNNELVKCSFTSLCTLNNQRSCHDVMDDGCDALLSSVSCECLLLLLTESLGTVYCRADGRAEKSRPNCQMTHWTITRTLVLKYRNKTKFLKHQSFVELR